MLWYQEAMTAKLKEVPNLEKVKVAVIDNGFDYESLRDFHPIGESFVYQADKEQNWFIPSDLHGTQMATFVTQLNPFCELYLAKVGHSRRDIKSDLVKDVGDPNLLDRLSARLADERIGCRVGYREEG
jgi:hypothetical protein